VPVCLVLRTLRVASIDTLNRESGHVYHDDAAKAASAFAACHENTLTMQLLSALSYAQRRAREAVSA
jgi:hypothetical protein